MPAFFTISFVEAFLNPFVENSRKAALMILSRFSRSSAIKFSCTQTPPLRPTNVVCFYHFNTTDQCGQEVKLNFYCSFARLSVEICLMGDSYKAVKRTPLFRSSRCVLSIGLHNIFAAKKDQFYRLLHRFPDITKQNTLTSCRYLNIMSLVLLKA